MDDDADEHPGEDPPARPGRLCCRFFSKRCCCALPQQGWAEAGNIYFLPFNCHQDLRDDGDDDDDDVFSLN